MYGVCRFDRLPIIKRRLLSDALMDTAMRAMDWLATGS